MAGLQITDSDLDSDKSGSLPLNRGCEYRVTLTGTFDSTTATFETADPESDEWMTVQENGSDKELTENGGVVISGPGKVRVSAPSAGSGFDVLLRVEPTK